jgi:hypothetical protein
MWKDYWFAGATRSYWVLSTTLMLAYVLAMLLDVHLDSGASTLFRVLAALLPAVLIIGFVLLEFRRVRNTDELRQRMELEAGMLTLAVAAVHGSTGSPRAEFFAQSWLTGNMESHHERNFLLRAG